MALTDTFIKQVKPTGSKTGDKYADGGGMYLLVKPAGRYWRMDYRYAGKRRTLALGTYPDVKLADARKAREKARSLLAQGVDPGTAKREDRQAEKLALANTFEQVAREFHQLKAQGWSEGHATKWMRASELHLFPRIGALPVATIRASTVLDALRKAEEKGILSTAHDLQQMAGQVFRYAVQTGRAEQNPVPDLKGALKPHIARHFAATLDPVKAGELLRCIDSYTGQPTTRAALQLAALFFQRPGNIRAMEWAWLDFDEALLRIPPGDMKRTVAAKINGKAHLVPLARQAIDILKGLRPLTGHGRYVFPGLRTGARPMSNNTMNAALRRMDYGPDDHVAHGFRAMARTMIGERMDGIPDAMVEAQLAHGKSGPLGSAYDRAEFMEQRRAMMQTWADYLDRLRVGADVIPLPQRAA